MYRFALLALFSAVALTAGFGAPAATVIPLPRAAAPVVAPRVVSLPETPGEIQARLHATAEEWIVIYPKLQRIAALRDEVNAVAPDLADDYANAGRRGRGIGGMGRDSIDTPVANATGRARNRIEFPFDPERAVPEFSTFGGGRRAFDGAARRQPNAVETLLAELQSLLDNPDTPALQIFDKLEAVHAARAKAARELTLAQEDLLPLLTLDQVALLVAIGYLD